MDRDAGVIASHCQSIAARGRRENTIGRVSACGRLAPAYSPLT
jgi:hypothetical protein